MRVVPAENQTEVRPFAEIDKDLREANKTLAQARERLSEAQFAETAALNRVNELQKQFDAAAIVYRRNASHGTDWSQQERQRNAEVA